MTRRPWNRAAPRPRLASGSATEDAEDVVTPDGVTVAETGGEVSDADTIAAGSLSLGGAMTPASSIANLAAFAEAAEDAEKAKGLSGISNTLAPVAEIPAVSKNALGEIPNGAAARPGRRRDAGGAPRLRRRRLDLAAGRARRFLAHLKVLYWDSLEEGRATSGCGDAGGVRGHRAGRAGQAPVDWRALADASPGKACRRELAVEARAAEGSRSFLKYAVKWTRQWVLHTGAVGAGGRGGARSSPSRYSTTRAAKPRTPSSGTSTATPRATPRATSR